MSVSEPFANGDTGGNGNGGALSAPADDLVLPFQTVRSSIAGRLVRLGPCLDSILRRHDYPEAIGEILGQAVALTSLLGTAMKFDGRLILQTQTDGALDMMVVNYDTPGRLRGYANFDLSRVNEELAAYGIRPESGADRAHAAILGKGHLAMTIDPGGHMDRYQGIVALERESLSSAARTYFRQSEQLPTFLRLAVARVYEPDKGVEAGQDAWRWRAGGLLLQNIAQTGGYGSPEKEGEPLPLTGEDDEEWRRAETLAATVEDHELIDPSITPERLLYRLFHEEGVRVQTPHRLIDHCSCSRERVTGFLLQFAAEGLGDLREDDGAITVTCEFCNEKYRYEPGELE